MRTPDIQLKLKAIAARIDAGEVTSGDELRALADALSRRKGTRGRRVSPPMTKEMAIAIRMHHLLHPEKSQAEIARFFGVSDGRVSEVLKGKRT